MTDAITGIMVLIGQLVERWGVNRVEAILKDLVENAPKEVDLAQIRAAAKRRIAELQEAEEDPKGEKE